MDNLAYGSGMRRSIEVCTDHAKACHETRTVVEKLVMDTNPKLRYKKSDC